MTNASSNKLAVIGQGYVGLPLSLVFAETGRTVVGLDIDPVKVEALGAGKSYIRHISAGRISAQVNSGNFEPSTDFSRLRECDAILICVPTPLNRYREPDISYIINTTEEIAKYLSQGPKKLVVQESTTYPGMTDGEVKETLEAGSGLKAGEGFHLAYSPEREDPGNPASRVKEIPKIVGGLTPTCLDLAVKLYRSALNNVVPVSSCRVAEATKLTENIFRSVNIALVNELKVVFAKMDIDIWEVIEAAKTKPFGFMPFYPGPGLGGHCIPVDPFYLTWKAREFDIHTRFIELAGEMNNSMLDYTMSRVQEALNHFGKPMMDSKILVVGLAYKAEVDDLRESPSLQLLKRLERGGAIVEYHDPYIPVITAIREHPELIGKKSVRWEAEELARFDAALIATNHKCVDLKILVQNVPCIIDCRNALGDHQTKAGQVWKA